MNGVSIGIICAVIGAIIGIVGAARLSKLDTKEETRGFTRVETKIDLMGVDVRDIKTKIDTQTETNNVFEHRLTKVEESVKSAHHRVDDHLGVKEAE